MRLFLKQIDWILEVESNTTNKNIHTIVCNWPDDRKMTLTKISQIWNMIKHETSYGLYFSLRVCFQVKTWNNLRRSNSTTVWSWRSP